MRKITFIMLILFCAAVCGFAADPVEGFWLSIDEKTQKVTGGWHIYQEGGKLMGKLLSGPDDGPDTLADKCEDSYKGFPLSGKVNQMKVFGTPWIFGLTLDKAGQPGSWSGGNVIDPTDGKMWKCKIIFRAAGSGKNFVKDTLEMRGEWNFGIGRSQFWQRSDQQTASTLYKP